MVVWLMLFHVCVLCVSCYVVLFRLEASWRYDVNTELFFYAKVGLVYFYQLSVVA